MENEDELDALIAEAKLMVNVCNNSRIILDRIDKRFEDITSLGKTDWMFLLFATTLQVLRQYFLTSFTEERMNDKDAAESTWGHSEEHTDRYHKWYHPSVNEILTNPVPFDASFGSPDWNLGLHGTQHRFKTLGHDPIAGFYFGTMNILTSTLTMYNLDSYHVKTGFTANNSRRDKITNKANLAKIISYSKKRLIDEGIEGKSAVGAALFKEYVHLRTDIKSKQSLSLPFLSRIDPAMAKEAVDYGLDIQNIETIGQQMSASIFINTIIACVHKLCKPKSTRLDMYEAKTRKILLYSNLIASSSNVLYVMISENIKKLDIGGLLVTIYRVFKDTIYIEKLKSEFISDEFQKVIFDRNNIYGF